MSSDDQLLMAFANQHRGDLDGLLKTFFRFLHTYTDLYVVDENPSRMGFKPGQAEAKVLAAFRGFPLKEPAVESIKRVRNPPQPNQGRESNAPTVAAARTDPSMETSVETKGEPNNDLASSQRSTPGETMKRASGNVTVSGTAATQMPVGNGGSGPGYVWTQSLGEVNIHASVPASTRGKDLEVTLKPGGVKVVHRPSKNTLLEGEFPPNETINVSESSWTLDESLLLILVKRRETWWPSVVRGHPEIDTSKVDSTKKVSEYDPETQAAIRKLLTEQHASGGGL
jgi:hypothetical protein